MYRPPPTSAPGFQGSPPPPGIHPSSATSSPWQRPPRPMPPAHGVVNDGMVPSPPPAQLWKEHQNAEGRKYWFNTITRKSTWEKPEELLTPEEKALMNCPWKEYKTPEGKTYYSHSQTKESKWTIPDEYKELKEKAEEAKERAVKEAQRPTPPPPQVQPRPQPQPQPAPHVPTPHILAPHMSAPHMHMGRPLPPAGIATAAAANAAGGPSAMAAPGGPSNVSHNVRPDMNETRQHKYRQPPPSAALLSQVPVPEFPTKEEAEKAFFKLLKETGVRTDWTWEQTMPEIITHPMYRALKTPGERKAAFHTYIDREAKRERELREEKESKQRVVYFHMLENTKEIKPYSRYHSVVKYFNNQPAYQQIKSETQRELYFEEFVHGLQRREKERLRELRKINMEQFAELLRQIPEITYETQWKDAQGLYTKHPTFEEDPKAFEAMDMLDFLTVFEEHSKMLWEAPLEELNRNMRDRRRAERRAREGFKNLLVELERNGAITARSLWKEIYPQIKEDPRYTHLLGIPDSTPFDLFCDMLDDLDEKLYHDKRLIYDGLKDLDFEVTLDTSFEDYQEVLKRSHDVMDRTKEANIKIIFDHLQNKAAQRLKDEKRRQEKKMKKKMDALRHAMKYLDPAIGVDDSWETVRPRIENLPEYQAIENEQHCIEAYEKFIKRLKEKHAEQDDEEEEGMIKDDEEYTGGGYSKHHGSRRYNGNSKHYSRQRAGSDRDSDHGGYSDEERSRRRKKRRHVSSHHDETFDNPADGQRSSAEEGEALDEYENDPRRMH